MTDLKEGQADWYPLTKEDPSDEFEVTGEIMVSFCYDEGGEKMSPEKTG
jgi:hypothetical protein